MAGQRDIAVPAHRRNPETVRLRPPCRKRQLLFFVTRHLRIAERIFALIVFAILFNFGELALSRRVIHQGDQRYRLAAYQLFKQRQGGVVRQLAAQVQAVLGAVEAALLRLLHGVDHLLQVLQTVATVAHVTDGHRVQYGGDAAGDHQRVVAAHRRMRGPVDLRARGEEFIQIIGMQFNQPRQQPAAFTVHRLGQAALGFSKRADCSVLDLNRAVNHLIIQHQLDVIDNHTFVPIGCSLSATRVRTLPSWKIPTIAAPRALACSISSTTAALFLASSEAVGSSRSKIG